MRWVLRAALVHLVGAVPGGCPARTAFCPGTRGGCAPGEAGSAVCCGDGTACAQGYVCGTHGGGVACVLGSHGARAVLPTPLPMGTAGWTPRYHLCQPGGLPLEFLELGPTLRFPYYSSVGKLERPLPPDVTHALFVIHGDLRNADDYFCVGLQVAAMSRLAGRVAVFAPHFLEHSDDPAPGVAFWNGSYPDGCWRCGAQIDAASSASATTVSSFGVLDAMVGALLDTNRNSSLRAVTLAGHSSGGQFVPRQLAKSGAKPV